MPFLPAIGAAARVDGRGRDDVATVRADIEPFAKLSGGVSNVSAGMAEEKVLPPPPVRAVTVSGKLP
jgi:hypothetical protein